MRSLKQVLVGLLVSLSGVGTASIGGLPGVPKPKTQVEEKVCWVNWGGSHLSVPEVHESQQAFEQGADDQAHRSLCKVRGSMKQGRIVETTTFEIQLHNNLAVSALNCSQHVDDARKQQRLRNLARGYISRAAQRRTSSLELSDAVKQNLDLINREW